MKGETKTRNRTVVLEADFDEYSPSWSLWWDGFGYPFNFRNRVRVEVNVVENKWVKD